MRACRQLLQRPDAFRRRVESQVSTVPTLYLGPWPCPCCSHFFTTSHDCPSHDHSRHTRRR